MPDESKPKPKHGEEFFKDLRNRFTQAEEAEAPIRKGAESDLEFLTPGGQWDYSRKNAREQAGRPCLEIDLLSPAINQAVNQQRQARQHMQVNPVGDGADEDTAQIIQGLVRHVEVASQADVAYDTAYEYAARSSFGYFEVRTRRIPGSFDQEITLDRIADPSSVYFGPADEPDYSDGEWAFKVQKLSEETYKRKYPTSQASKANFFKGSGSHHPATDWMGSNGEVMVAEYWYVEFETRKLQHLSEPISLEDGSTKAVLYEDEYDELPEGVTILEELEDETRRVFQGVTNGIEWLEEPTEWGSQYIGIVPVLGAEVYVKGKRHLQSMIRGSHDAQRLHNYYASGSAETVALAPRAPYEGYVGQFKSKGADFRRMIDENQPYLEFDTAPVGWNPAWGPPPLPRRNVTEPPIQALVQSTQMSEHFVQATTNVYPELLGAPKADESGKAVLARQAQQQNGNFHLADNLNRARWHAGRIILELIPVIYDTDRVIRIVKPNSQHELVRINSMFDRNGQPVMGKDGKVRPKGWDVRIGRYDITISSGPSYETRRQEAVASMQAFAQAAPDLVPQWGYLWVKEMDWPGKDAISDAITPPGVKQMANGQMTPAQFQQMAQQNQLLTQAVQKLQMEKQTKLWEIQGKMQLEDKRLQGKQWEITAQQSVDLQKTRMNNEAMIDAAQAKAGIEQAATAYEMKNQMLISLWEKLHEFVNAEMDRNHERQLSAQEHQQTLAQQAAMPQPQPQPTQ